MNLKKIVKWVSPPILLDIYRRCRHVSSAPGHHIWEGIYKHYRDVLITGEGYEGHTLVNITHAETEIVLANSENCGTIPKSVTGDQSLLPLLASILGKDSRRIRVLDFGGGMGIDYIHLISSIVACQLVDYYVIETEKMSREGNLLFAKDVRVHFCSLFPTDLSDIDIIHMDSVLQYIEDYAALLRTLCAYQPRYFLFVRLSAGDIPTYATIQKNMPGMMLAYWFINVNEIIEIMSANGYSLIFKSASEEKYNQDNFPQEYRLGRTCNLLFSRH